MKGSPAVTIPLALIAIALCFNAVIKVLSAFQATPNVTVKMLGCESEEPPCVLKGTLSRDFFTRDFVLEDDEGAQWRFREDAFAYMSYPVPNGL